MTTVLSSLATPAGPANTSALSAQVVSCSKGWGACMGGAEAKFGVEGTVSSCWIRGIMAMKIL